MNLCLWYYCIQTIFPIPNRRYTMRPLRWFEYLTINAYAFGSSFLGSSIGPLIGPLLMAAPR